MVSKLENFLLLTSKYLAQFYAKGIITSYGLIGGFALGVFGLPRATGDLDFLVGRDDLEN